jgi:hypothetical protein
MAMVVAVERARTPSASWLLPARKVRMIKAKEMLRRTETVVHHQCSKRAIRKLHVRSG